MLRHSYYRRIDGLWVGCFRSEDRARILDGLETSLGLIRLHDPLRYKRLTHDLERIWVNLVPGYRAHYRSEFRMCELDERFVLADTTRPEMIASVIVHEATHARLHDCGIGYEERIRPRVEAICIRRQSAFAAKLPGGEEAREEAELNLAPRPPEFWSNTGFRDRNDAGSVEALQYLGVSDRCIQAILVGRAWVSAVQRAARRLPLWPGKRRSN